MAKLFMIMHEDADGVGGDILAYGETYRDLLLQLVERYDLVYEDCADQIQEEESDTVEYIAECNEKKHCTAQDVRRFNIVVAGVALRCSELFRGKKGFASLIEHIESEYYGEGGLGSPITDVEATALIAELRRSYDDDEALRRIFGTINERIWCG